MSFMRNYFTIGFKFSNEDFTALVTMISTPAYRFYKITLHNEDLQNEFGTSLSFCQDALKKEIIQSLKAKPTSLYRPIIDELKCHV